MCSCAHTRSGLPSTARHATFPAIRLFSPGRSLARARSGASARLKRRQSILPPGCNVFRCSPKNLSGGAVAICRTDRARKPRAGSLPSFAHKAAGSIEASLRLVASLWPSAPVPVAFPPRLRYDSRCTVDQSISAVPEPIGAGAHVSNPLARDGTDRIATSCLMVPTGCISLLRAERLVRAMASVRILA